MPPEGAFFQQGRRDAAGEREALALAQPAARAHKTLGHGAPRAVGRVFSRARLRQQEGQRREQEKFHPAAGGFAQAGKPRRQDARIVGHEERALGQPACELGEHGMLWRAPRAPEHHEARGAAHLGRELGDLGLWQGKAVTFQQKVRVPGSARGRGLPVPRGEARLFRYVRARRARAGSHRRLLSPSAWSGKRRPGAAPMPHRTKKRV